MKNYSSYSSNSPYYPESLSIKDEKIISDIFREQNHEQPKTPAQESKPQNQAFGIENLLGLLGKGGGLNSEMLTGLLANNLFGGQEKSGNFMAEAIKMMMNPQKKKEKTDSNDSSSPTTFEEM